MAKKNRKKIIISIICVLVIGWGSLAIFKPDPVTNQFITSSVMKSDIENSVLATGILEATKMVSVGAQVSGQVKKMYVELGDEVKAGDLIAEIDSVRQTNDVKTAEANIANQKAQLAVKEANLEKTKAEYQRQKAMFEQDATSRAEFEAALASFKISEADIKAINAQIEQSKLTLATAKEDLGYTRIVAPMDGTVVAIVTEEGQTVNANQTAPTIVKLAKLDTMTIKVEISEADVMRVEKGQMVYFNTLGNNDKKIYATLRQVEPAPNSINSESNSSSSKTAVYYNALFDVPNEDGKLRIDMTAQVYIVLDEAKDTLSIPAAAIQAAPRDKGNQKPTAAANKDAVKDSAKTSASETTPPVLTLTEAEKALVAAGKASLETVKVIQADKTAKATPVLIGLNNRVTAQVLKGLKLGDEVVIADSGDTSNDAAKRGMNGSEKR
jgi:membrane fusion protein, macrolide-specific efflux system